MFAIEPLNIFESGNDPFLSSRVGLLVLYLSLNTQLSQQRIIVISECLNP